MMRRQQRSTLFPQHDARPICLLHLPAAVVAVPEPDGRGELGDADDDPDATPGSARVVRGSQRSEEPTSDLQSRHYLVCRLLLEKTTALSSPLPSFPTLHPPPF